MASDHICDSGSIVRFRACMGTVCDVVCIVGVCACGGPPVRGVLSGQRGDGGADAGGPLGHRVVVTVETWGRGGRREEGGAEELDWTEGRAPGDEIHLVFVGTGEKGEAF